MSNHFPEELQLYACARMRVCLEPGGLPSPAPGLGIWEGSPVSVLSRNVPLPNCPSARHFGPVADTGLSPKGLLTSPECSQHLIGMLMPGAASICNSGLKWYSDFCVLQWEENARRVLVFFLP